MSKTWADVHAKAQQLDIDYEKPQEVSGSADVGPNMGCERRQLVEFQKAPSCWLDSATCFLTGMLHRGVWRPL